MKRSLALMLATYQLLAQEIIGPIRIHAGTNPYTDASGQIWAPDLPYVQGVTAVSTEPLASVANATNIALYQAQRISLPMGGSCSPFSYVIAVPNNRYRVTLKLAELGGAARTFTASLNGMSLPAKITTLPGSASDSFYYVNVAGEPLTVSLSATGSENCPILSALEIVPQIPIGEADITALAQDLSTVVRRGPGFGIGAVAMVNSNGQLETVAGDAGACVLTDGTTKNCGDVDAETPQGTLDGVNNAFTLSQTPVPAESLILTRNGLVLATGPDYTVTGATISFAAGAVPKAGDILQAFYRY